MFILVACEESQEVCKAFRERGHEAFSCDIVPCSGGHPEWHIKGDCTPLINNGVVHRFTTQDRKEHTVDAWDMLLAFPPCTHLALSGAQWFPKKRADGRQRVAIQFFCLFLNSNIKKVCIENPRGIMSGGDYLRTWYKDIVDLQNVPRKESQVIQPYMFGHKSKKTTCLWLKNLSLLESTEIVKPDLVHYVCSNGKIATFSSDYGPGGGENGARRSKTYPGIAKAMAEQWG